MSHPNDQEKRLQSRSSADLSSARQPRSAANEAARNLAPDSEFVRSILTNLGREICLPLDGLRGGITQVILDRSGQITEVERNQAETMLALCDDLGRLTRECLGIEDPTRD